jgi:hypothetical protein
MQNYRINFKILDVAIVTYLVAVVRLFLRKRVNYYSSTEVPDKVEVTQSSDLSPENKTRASGYLCTYHLAAKL